MAGWSWAAPNGPGDFPAQKHPWRPRSIISAASLSLVTLCLFPPLLSPRRDLAAGRDGVRRRHAAVDPIDAGPPRALADYQPRSVTLSATACLLLFVSPDSVFWSSDQCVATWGAVYFLGCGQSPYIQILGGFWSVRSWTGVLLICCRRLFLSYFFLFPPFFAERITW